MKRSRGEELLLASWEGRLPEEEGRELASLLAADAGLRRTASAWERLAEVGRSDEMRIPSERMRQRLQGSLDAVRAFERSRFPGLDGARSPGRRMAAAAALVAAGLTAGLLGAAWHGARSDVRELRSELGDLRSDVVLSLLEHQAASERLRGVAWSGDGAPASAVLEALVEAARRDPSVNVRLAAVDALSGHLDRDSRRRLAASLPEQASPLVQLRLVEALFADGGGDLDRESLLAPGVLDETVRRRLAALAGGDA